VDIFSRKQSEQFSKQLEGGCRSLNIGVDGNKITKYLLYLDLFHKWNKSYNLSAIRQPEHMPSKHILDSLSIQNHLEGNTFLDVGSGGGLPGIPLAISMPNKRFTLLDANGKKTRFLFQVKQSLSLDNVEIINERVEEYQVSVPFEGVICRAYSSISGIVSTCAHLHGRSGKIFAMKGLIPRDELSELQKHYKVETIHRLEVPGVEGERNLIILAIRD